MPREFDFASIFAPNSRIDLYSPFPLTAETDRWGNTLSIIGRLKPGVTIERAQAEMNVLVSALHQEHPDRGDWWGARLTGLQDQISGRLRRALVVLGAAVGVVMLIVCANLSNLLLARAAGRRKEIAVRVALGAGRWRLIRQMLTESVVLSFCGAALGMLLAVAATKAFRGDTEPEHSPDAIHLYRSDGDAVHDGDGDRHGIGLWDCSGTATIEGRLERVVERFGKRDERGQRQGLDSQRAGDLRSRDGVRASGGRGGC